MLWRKKKQSRGGSGSCHFNRLVGKGPIKELQEGALGLSAGRVFKAKGAASERVLLRPARRPGSWNRVNMRESGRRRGQKTNRKPDYIGLCRALGFSLECDGETRGSF